MTRREQSEKIYRDKFEEFGLSEQFELIKRDWTSDHGRKCIIKCKTCGSEFSTWALDEIRKGRQARLICKDCGASSDNNDMLSRSPQAKEIAELYLQGLEQTEIAKRYGCTTDDVGNITKKFGIVDSSRKCRGAQKANAKRKIEAEASLEKLLNDKGFFYCGGYSDKKGKVKISCSVCGAEFVRTAKHIRKVELITCPECEKQKTAKKQEHQKIIARQNAEMRALERKWYKLICSHKNYYDEVHEAFLESKGVCEICGKEYTVREYIESAGLKKAADNGVCSAECKKEKAKRIKRKYRTPSNHRHRAKQHGVEYEPGITLKKLVKRDGLRCAICGELCDWNDHTWSDYAGPRYPSIDHIIPMSKGGGHVWNNVQVTHMICNSKKSDKMEVVV